MSRRKFKFRAWDKEDKRMIIDEQDFIPLKVTNKGILRLIPNNTEDLWSIVNGDRFELMQFTGLYDKNRIEIFEFDIVEEPYFSNVNPNDHDDDNYFDDTPRKYVICYDSKQAKYKSVPISMYKDNAGNVGWPGYDVKYELIKVVGNIYENEDLINSL